MSDTVIRVENIGKHYRIGLKDKAPKTLLKTVTGLAGAPFKYLRSVLREPAPEEVIWSLKDISFEVKQGEVLGIIGRNGAGKSTLLKILSRITEPSCGYAEIRGRVGSLLEVGTGFHPDLTGRENTYLNGTIMGMKKREINRRFDEIVAFAEVEKFIDTPVKFYSSGMYTRLAFAVAAHLEPEILIMDEVLAVGDIQFQKKCLGKMGDVATKEGRTVLFVSHNMDSIVRLCEKAILLKDGKTQYTGSTEKAISFYLKSDFGTTAIRRWSDISRAPGNETVRLIEVKVHTEDNKVSENFDITKRIGITMNYEVLQDGHKLTHSYNLFNQKGIHILSSHDVVSDLREIPRTRGNYSSTMWLPGNLLSEGSVLVGAAVITIDPLIIHFNELDAVAFNVVDNIDGNSARGKYVGGFPGVVRPLLEWETVK